MTDAFGTEIFRSLTDTSYNTRALNMVRFHSRATKPSPLRIHTSARPKSPVPA
jgi:hypothetical protein